MADSLSNSQGAEPELSRGLDERERICVTQRLLVDAVRRRDIAFVKRLLASGADPNSGDASGCASLIACARDGHVELGRSLLEHGADVNSPDPSGLTPLLIAAKKGNAEIIQVLLDAGANVDARDKRGNSALMRAASRGYGAVVTMLLEAGASINATNEDGVSALMRAAALGYADTVRALLAAGADVDMKEPYGNTALSFASANGHEAVVRVLMNEQSIGTVMAGHIEPDHQGESPLVLAARGGYAAVVKQLLGTTLDESDPFGGEINDSKGTCREAREGNGMLGVVVGGLANAWKGLRSRLHRPAGQLRDVANSVLAGTIHEVFEVGKIEAGKALIEAAGRGHLDTVRVLLAFGADIETQGAQGQTPLIAALAAGHVYIAELLIEGGADPDAVDVSGNTPREIACRKGLEGILKFGPKPFNASPHRDGRGGTGLAKEPDPGLRTTAAPSKGAEMITVEDDNEDVELTGERNNSTGEVDSIAATDANSPMVAGPGRRAPERSSEALEGPRLVALAEFMYHQMGEALVAEITKTLGPSGARGETQQVLAETFFEHDPAWLLKECLSEMGAMKALADLGITPKLDGGANLHLNALLRHFGVQNGAKANIEGPHAVCRRLFRLEADIRYCSSNIEMGGAAKDACSMVERLLRSAIWAWLQLCYGVERDQVILSTLDSVKTGEYDLDRISFGHISWLFDRLRELVERSPNYRFVERTLGRRPLSETCNTKGSFKARLNEIVKLRNWIVHDRHNKLGQAPLGSLREMLCQSVKDARDLVSDCVEAKIIPRMATVENEIRDRVGRLTYSLLMEDGTLLKVHSSSSLKLGLPLWYFGSGANPRPVDPLILYLDDLGPVP